MKHITRRRFLKNSLIAGAATVAVPTLFVPKAPAAWARKTLVHPNVDNLRVVGIADPGMTLAQEPACNWFRQEELVAVKAVWENMDRLACSLAQVPHPEQAWKTIFLKPPRTAWSDVVVAVKSNHIAQQHTRSAVMAKVCRTLTDILGVKGSNIHIYDACHGEDMSRDTPFRGLPEGCRIENRWGGSRTETGVPEPWRGENSSCLKHLVDGTVDILVNISMCKGHSRTFGGFTMTMKNHFGTFSPGPGHRSGALDYLLAINQTPEVLGPMDKRTGRVLYPRQQLCIVDALWAGQGGPGGNPSHQPNFLAMGVLSPVVDYLVATRFRGEKMGWKPEPGVTARILTEFGYSESDLPEGGRIIEAGG
ncbi:MAG: DUF362 domain-containing protein [Deltaproteobacteria bacterium]|nr:DUF362 domain-containing protein [Deltaproteobacteria bacterium]